MEYQAKAESDEDSFSSIEELIFETESESDFTAKPLPDMNQNKVTLCNSSNNIEYIERKDVLPIPKVRSMRKMHFPSKRFDKCEGDNLDGDGESFNEALLEDEADTFDDPITEEYEKMFSSFVELSHQQNDDVKSDIKAIDSDISEQPKVIAEEISEDFLTSVINEQLSIKNPPFDVEQLSSSTEEVTEEIDSSTCTSYSLSDSFSSSNSDTINSDSFSEDISEDFELQTIKSTAKIKRVLKQLELEKIEKGCNTEFDYQPKSPLFHPKNLIGNPARNSSNDLSMTTPKIKQPLIQFPQTRSCWSTKSFVKTPHFKNIDRNAESAKTLNCSGAMRPEAHRETKGNSTVDGAHRVDDQTKKSFNISDTKNFPVNKKSAVSDNISANFTVDGLPKNHHFLNGTVCLDDRSDEILVIETSHPVGENNSGFLLVDSVEKKPPLPHGNNKGLVETRIDPSKHYSSCGFTDINEIISNATNTEDNFFKCNIGSDGVLGNVVSARFCSSKENMESNILSKNLRSAGGRSPGGNFDSDELLVVGNCLSLDERPEDLSVDASIKTNSLSENEIKSEDSFLDRKMAGLQKEKINCDSNKFPVDSRTTENCSSSHEIRMKKQSAVILNALCCLFDTANVPEQIQLFPPKYFSSQNTNISNNESIDTTTTKCHSSKQTNDLLLKVLSTELESKRQRNSSSGALKNTLSNKNCLKKYSLEVTSHKLIPQFQSSNTENSSYYKVTELVRKRCLFGNIKISKDLFFDVLYRVLYSVHHKNTANCFVGDILAYKRYLSNQSLYSDARLFDMMPTKRPSSHKRSRSGQVIEFTAESTSPCTESILNCEGDKTDAKESQRNLNNLLLNITKSELQSIKNRNASYDVLIDMFDIEDKSLNKTCDSRSSAVSSMIAKCQSLKENKYSNDILRDMLATGPHSSNYANLSNDILASMLEKMCRSENNKDHLTDMLQDMLDTKSYSQTKRYGTNCVAVDMIASKFKFSDLTVGSADPQICIQADEEQNPDNKNASIACPADKPDAECNDQNIKPTAHHSNCNEKLNIKQDLLGKNTFSNGLLVDKLSEPHCLPGNKNGQSDLLVGISDAEQHITRSKTSSDWQPGKVWASNACLPNKKNALNELPVVSECSPPTGNDVSNISPVNKPTAESHRTFVSKSKAQPLNSFNSQFQSTKTDQNLTAVKSSDVTNKQPLPVIANNEDATSDALTAEENKHLKQGYSSKVQLQHHFNQGVRGILKKPGKRKSIRRKSVVKFAKVIAVVKWIPRKPNPFLFCETLDDVDADCDDYMTEREKDDLKEWMEYNYEDDFEKFDV